MTSPDRDQDPWAPARLLTPSRVGLPRAGWSLATAAVLDAGVAHAAARDAVHEPLAVEALSALLAPLGLGRPHVVRSRARSRTEYLRRPDLGRLPADLSTLPPPTDRPPDVAVVVGDGLSARAVTDHAAGVLAALVERLGGRLTFAPLVVALDARVAIGDHIGAHFDARSVVVLIGERPGLSVADSLGAYVTYAPRPGRTDAERNCVSNVHPPDGLGYAGAADTIASILDEARRRGRSGVELKPSAGPPALPS